MAHEGPHVLGPQHAAQLLRAAARVAEHQPLLTAVKARDHRRCVFEAADVIDGDISFGAYGGAAHYLPRSNRSKPLQKLLRVTDRR